MDKKVIALFLIALLGGLFGGFGLGYIIYQPQIQNLQEDLSNLNNRLDTFNSTLANTQSSVTSLQNQLTSLNSEITQLNSTINNMQSSITSIQTQLSSLQSQLSSLQNQLQSINVRLTSLNTTITQIENRRWHQVSFISGTGNQTTGYFQLTGKMFHIAWGYNALYTDSWIEIILRFQNGTIDWINGSSGVFGAFDAEGPIEQVGSYYLDIIVSSSVDWLVYIEDFY